jgi:hypothetical protein
LRAHRPDAFGGAYTPLPAGDDACAFLRGDSVLAATALRASSPASSVSVPAGTWRDVLSGGERSLGGAVPVAELVGEHGVALLERTSR